MTTTTDWRERFNDIWNERGDIGLTKQEIIDFIAQEVSAAEARGAEREKEKVKGNYIQWVLANSYSRPYKGDTPFWQWRQLAEVKDMGSWK